MLIDVSAQLWVINLFEFFGEHIFLVNGFLLKEEHLFTQFFSYSLHWVYTLILVKKQYQHD